MFVLLQKIFLGLFFITSFQIKAQINLNGSVLLCKSNYPSALHLNAPQATFSLKLQPITHRAFFCRMEDKVYARLNVWVKLRAGNDEIYRNMTGGPFERMN